MIKTANHSENNQVKLTKLYSQVFLKFFYWNKSLTFNFLFKKKLKKKLPNYNL